MLREKATFTNFIVFGLTRSGLKSTIYCTRGEHTNHCITDAVQVAFGEIGLVRETLIYADFVFQIYSLEIHFQDYFFPSHFVVYLVIKED